MTLPTRVLYYGKDEPLPEQIPLRAGPLSLVYENGDLRYVKLGDQELLRRVYVAVRDRNWGTVPNRFSNVQMQINEDSFEVAYTVDNQQGEIDFRWQGLIHGDNQGTITFHMTGEAQSAFLRNRIGFCVLHPMALAGVAARIEHMDGQTEANVFPVHIAPQRVVNGEIKPVIPFNEMRAVAHEVKPGLWAEVRFSGDIFEMEDQRNWTDASYKTYSTPLRLPFPAAVQQGDKITQTVTLRLVDERPTPNDERGLPQSDANRMVVRLAPNQPGVPLPRLGLGMASHGQALSATEVARLRALNLDHLRVDLKFAEPDYAVVLQQATAEAHALGVTLHVALHLTDAATAELATFAQLLQTVKPPVSAWLVFHEREKTTSDPWVQLVRQALAAYDPVAKIGAGTNVYFTELNRSRPPVQVLDVVAYSLNPQVHAFDNNSLVETLAAQAATVNSARQFCGDLPLLISPVTLQPRFNPNATGPEPMLGPGELPPQVDPRQMALLGAGWTLGSIKYLAEGGAASVTYYETTGWRGVMETADGASVPEKFRSIPGAVFPLYHVLADVGEFSGGEVLPTLSSDNLRVEGLALRKGNHLSVFLANLTHQSQTVTISALAPEVRLRILDETNAETAMHSPEVFRSQTGELRPTRMGILDVKLLPYAIARIDFVGTNEHST